MASSPNTAASWPELPRDITAAILHKLGAVEMLETAQKVCTAWRSVCQDPSMWRHIDMYNLDDSRAMPYNLEKMCWYAVDRSQGQLIAINIGYFGTDELLHYISQSCSQLRHLGLDICFNISSKGLIEAVKKLPFLEELHLCYLEFIDTVEVIEAIGKFCPQLKSFTLNHYWFSNMHTPFDMEAQAIAKNMPQLRHLQLLGNQMTTAGLEGILDACPHLESLDVRECFNMYFRGDIEKQCTQRIKDLRRPDDPTHDYGFPSDVYDHGTSDYDNATGFSFSDIETMSDYVDYMDENLYDYEYEYDLFFDD